MTSTGDALRRGPSAVLAAVALGGVIVAALTANSATSATAATDPCAASEVARTVGSVATSTGSYLDSHPETNQALTTISQQQAGPQSLAALKTYFDANPQAGKDMQALQQPLTSLAGRCKLPVTIPQIMGLLQGAQQGGELPGVAASLPSAQAVGSPGLPSSAGLPATSASMTGTGPLPGPSASTAR